MSVDKAHQLLGHVGEAETRAIARRFGWKLTRGSLKQCESCAIGKAKQKNVRKESIEVGKSTDRHYLDIKTIRNKKGQPATNKPHWRIMVQEVIGFKWSDFFATKNSMPEPTCELLHSLRKSNQAVKTLRMDNAGENKTLENRMKSSDWKLGVKVEYTAARTPQQNSLAEVGFHTISNRMRAMMKAAHFPKGVRHRLWREVVSTATKLDNLSIVEINGEKKTRFEHKFGTNPGWCAYIRAVGEAGVVKTRDMTSHTGPLDNRGTTCVMVGYAENHPPDTYRMWNPNTKKITLTRDIIWLNRMYYRKKDREPVEDSDDDIVLPFTIIDEALKPGRDEDQDDSNAIEEANEEPEEEEEKEESEDEESEIASDTDSTRAGEDEDEPEDDDEEVITTVTRTGRTVKPRDRLIETGYAVTEPHVLLTKSGEQAFIGAALGGGFDDTSELHVLKYKEAMQQPDADKWQMAVDEEHDRMKKHHVWEPVARDKVPKGMKIIDSTWAMKKKSNGTYRARMNARGFRQIDGEHYESHQKAAPVANDITIRIVLVLMLLFKFHGELLDVKGAFLHGTFGDNERIYMEVPEGMTQHYPKGSVLLLLRTLYGLVQGARAFWTVLLNCFKDMGYKRSTSDPCLYFCWTMYGLVMWLSWIDDCLVCGHPKAVAFAKEQLKARFDCEDVGPLSEYVGCKIDRGKNWIRLTQPVLLQSFEDEFPLPKKATPSTPAKPGTTLYEVNDNQTISDEQQKLYRKGVGKLLHLCKWSKVEIQNAVRELSGFMMSATTSHLDALYHCMNYCVGTKETGLLLKTTREWDGNPEFKLVISGRADAAQGGNGRNATSGWIVRLEGAPVSIHSRGQKCATVSVTEAELVATMDCVQDMLYVKSVVESLGLNVQTPMIIECDNKGVIDLVNNWNVTGRTRHVSYRVNFLRDLKLENTLLIKHVTGDENESDIYTKNVTTQLFTKFVPRICSTNDETVQETDGSKGKSVGVCFDPKVIVQDPNGITIDTDIGLVGLNDWEDTCVDLTCVHRNHTSHNTPKADLGVCVNVPKQKEKDEDGNPG